MKAQSKVSMVVPCYNKAEYIGAMLDSVISQRWDNIELILVNDGSTDATRQVIADYEQRIKARGYDLIIVDQENGGCCAAVHAGLIRMSGDYFCLVDSDDEIYPEYVSRMAGWLDENEDYEWAMCSYTPYKKDSFKEEPMAMTSCAPMADNKQLLERHILRKIITTSWVYMTRAGYLTKCRLVENFCTERRKTYEPLFAVPLMLGGGKLKCFDEPLYKFNRFASDMYYFDMYEKVDKYYTDYSYLYTWCIERACISKSEKDRLLALVRLGKAKDCLYHLNDMDSAAHGVQDRERYIDDIAYETSLLIDELFVPRPQFKPEVFKSKDYMAIMDLLDHIVLETDYRQLVQAAKTSRIIAYGALGKNAQSLLPMFIGTHFEPELLWDAAANADSIVFGKAVAEPSFNQVLDSDIILVFPKQPEIAKYVEHNCPNNRVINVTSEKVLLMLIRFTEISIDCKFAF